MKKNVCVIGLGYIGLPTAALLANRGYQVHGVDVDEGIVETINRGEIHIKETGLHAFVNSAIKSGNLTANIKPIEADIFIIAVPTPFYPYKSGEVPRPNLEYVTSAINAIAPYLKPEDLIILESTHD